MIKNKVDEAFNNDEYNEYPEFRKGLKIGYNDGVRDFAKLLLKEVEDGTKRQVNKFINDFKNCFKCNFPNLQVPYVYHKEEDLYGMMTKN